MEGRTEWSFPVESVCAHGLFWLRFHVSLAMRAEYFGGPLAWWFSPFGPILLLSHCEPYKMDKATIVE